MKDETAEWETVGSIAKRILNTKPQIQWGHWHWNQNNNTIEYRHPCVLYYIDLDRMKTAAACLDWIFQLTQKTWMTPEDRSDMLLAIQYIVRPQEHLCGGAA